MKTVQKIGGVLILFATCKEYISASRQLGTLFSPGIIITILLLLVISSWLMASGFSKQKIRFKSPLFLKIYAASVAMVALAGITG